MAEALLGLDSGILANTAPKERAGYRLAVGLFAGVSSTMVAADAYFGHLFFAGGMGVVVFGSLLGYIHFAFYRLALITLTTRPLAEKEPPSAGGSVAGIRKWLRPDASSLFRILFVSLIALAVSFPGAALFYHRQAEQIQSVQREKIMAEMDQGIGSHLCNPESRFPFLVIETLWKKPGYRLLVFLWVIWIFSPLALLSRLRYAADMRYGFELAKKHREMVEKDFYSVLLEAQEDINTRFGGKVNLKELLVYEDAPFNTRFRNQKDRQFGDHLDFAAYLNSL